MDYDKNTTAISESELAQRASVSIAALRKRRREGRGPRFLKLGRGDPRGELNHLVDSLLAVQAHDVVEHQLPDLFVRFTGKARKCLNKHRHHDLGPTLANERERTVEIEENVADIGASLEGAGSSTLAQREAPAAGSEGPLMTGATRRLVPPSGLGQHASRGIELLCTGRNDASSCSLVSGCFRAVDQEGRRRAGLRGSQDISTSWLCVTTYRAAAPTGRSRTRFSGRRVTSTGR